MNEETKKIIADRVAQLPSYIQDSLKTIHWDQEIATIGKKYGLHVDQMGTLQIETVMVLVGIVHPDEYSKSLKQELNLPNEIIGNIIADVNEKIFKNVRQALIDFLASEDEAELNRVGAEGEATEDTATEEKPMENIFLKTGIELTAEHPPTEVSVPPSTAAASIEKQVLAHSGVVINEDAPETSDGADLDREGLLSTLENPPKASPSQFSHLIKSKLNSTVISPPEKTRYEDKKPIPTQATILEAQEKKSPSDPYREIVQ